MDTGARAALPAGGSLSPDVAAQQAVGDEARPLGAARTASHRLAHLARRVASARGGQIPPELRGIVEAHRDFHPRAEIGGVIQAYQAAERFHHGQMRRSGDPYIVHPLGVAEILAELGVDTTTLVASLLHDTVEDTGATLEVLADEFGTEVANLVDGVTKLDKMRFGDAAEAETLRKLIVALAKDYRVLVIKIADRLHNMRTLEFMSPPKQAKISQVTLEILAPLAHRLGVSVIKRELEDRAFAVLDPDQYRRTQELVDDLTAAERESGQLAAVVARLRAGLGEAKINGEVSVRLSHLFSIYKRAQDRGRPPRDYYDVVRVLVLVEDVRDCYAALGVIHGLWRPVPGRLRDFVATPKFNMYQSLHTTVTDATGHAVDIQIRTPQMHVLAETGIVARPVGESADGARLEGLSWLHSLLDWEGDAKDPGEFLESLSSDLDSDEVLAFTPKGKAIALPARSSPVDVAYAVHTDVGHRAVGARVNGRLVPLHTRLRNGDVVEILTSNLPHAGPSEDWLSFVKTARARVRIRRRLARGRREPVDSSSGSRHSPAPEAVVPEGAAPARRPDEAVAAATVAPTAPRTPAGTSGPPAGSTAMEGPDTRAVARAAALTPTGPVVGSLDAAPGAGGEPAATPPGDRPARTSAWPAADGAAGVSEPAVASLAPTAEAAPASAVARPGTVGVAAAGLADLAMAGAGTAADADLAVAGAAAAVSGGTVPGRSAPGSGGRRSRPAPAPVEGRRPTPAWAGVASLDGRPDAPVRIARCCLPLPGDELIGFVTHHGAHHQAVTLHRQECANARPGGTAAPVREPVGVLHWEVPPAHAFPAEIAVEAFDRYGLLADITEVLSDTAAGLRAASTSTSEDRVAHARFTVEVTGPRQLEAVLAAVRGVGGVYDCYRACQTAS
ncbi:RelA/SpoT family protein [Pseudofrankia inefficax]|uniref:(P)ppGpp synthetase I, SpoT/RelA n=1 Tax=Pseudofrankia inefficax (strain DSM 45817 / CECT 9037 / DDB 130130 / EuI1c) TaxID=298654 RepID=E3J092_PSEI1|nr:RelA/SpoT family protein [Pseudofrankia inefficax]ADP80375.1 (p)ppGpp synthetase I, SpoT/RelA [Pseudofrankia inefficax]